MEIAPLSPKNLGKTITAGIKKNPCFDIESKPAAKPFPSAWNKAMKVITKPDVGKKMFTA